MGHQYLLAATLNIISITIGQKWMHYIGKMEPTGQTEIGPGQFSC